jgi:hypothetical protein
MYTIKISSDKLLQILNVIELDISLINQKPDYYKHDIYFFENIQGVNLNI